MADSYELQNVLILYENLSREFLRLDFVYLDIISIMLRIFIISITFTFDLIFPMSGMSFRYLLTNNFLPMVIFFRHQKTKQINLVFLSPVKLNMIK